ncbi:o-succinylbenzoate synthase [Salisaeta longa]|uniref:o-succinylbenzoate synthase n=1 Tax=Salisaeta longa TaxID=503170 RepID=UPI000429142D|nr:o-succinylbenzoate synthase [Salisaeta longa]
MRTDCFRYRLPLSRPLRLGTQTVHHRDGAVLRCMTADGAVGWGDVAPLPGFSRETLDEALHQLATDAVHAALRSGDTTALGDVCASVQCGVAQAAADAQRDGPANDVTVPVNALLSGTPHAVLEAFEQYRADGYTVFKLKVGRRAPANDARLVSTLLDRMPPEGALRLDANRAWSWDEAQAFAAALGAETLAYVEEPLDDPTQLPALAADWPYPIALDESTRTLAPADLSDHTYAAAIVLKPMLIGGPHRLAAWADAAAAHDQTVVLSAAYESGVGMAALVEWSAAYATAPVGLDTYRHLQADVLATRLPLEVPHVSLRAVRRAACTVDPSRLSPYPLEVA